VDELGGHCCGIVPVSGIAEGDCSAADGGPELLELVGFDDPGAGRAVALSSRRLVLWIMTGVARHVLSYRTSVAAPAFT
jgi:hypothetical protein